jgi:hypothetical protein
MTITRRALPLTLLAPPLHGEPLSNRDLAAAGLAMT